MYTFYIPILTHDDYSGKFVKAYTPGIYKNEKDAVDAMINKLCDDEYMKFDYYSDCYDNICYEDDYNENELIEFYRKSEIENNPDVYNHKKCVNSEELKNLLKKIINDWISLERICKDLDFSYNESWSIQLEKHNEIL
jgi:hypothetical protein